MVVFFVAARIFLPRIDRTSARAPRRGMKASANHPVVAVGCRGAFDDYLTHRQELIDSPAITERRRSLAERPRSASDHYGWVADSRPADETPLNDVTVSHGAANVAKCEITREYSGGIKRSDFLTLGVNDVNSLGKIDPFRA